MLGITNITCILLTAFLKRDIVFSPYHWRIFLTNDVLRRCSPWVLSFFLWMMIWSRRLIDSAGAEAPCTSFLCSFVYPWSHHGSPVASTSFKTFFTRYSWMKTTRSQKLSIRQFLPLLYIMSKACLLCLRLFSVGVFWVGSVLWPVLLTV